MKILLINPLIREWAKPNCFPYGLGYVAASLRNAGHDVDVFDINALRPTDEEIEERIKGARYDLVGTGGIVTVYAYLKNLLAILKKHHPTKPIIVGGSVSTSIPKTMLEKTAADIACLDEGEITVCEVAEALENNKSLSGIQGIWFKDEKGIHENEPRAAIADLNTLPLPAYDLFPTEVYVNNPVGILNESKWVDGETQEERNIRTLTVHATRGCPYKCTYCYHDFMGAKWRRKSPRKIVDEIKHLKDTYQIDYFLIQDDLFTAKKSFVEEFCDLLIEEKLNLKWECAGKVNLADREMYLKMKEAGCICIGYGIESGSPTILKEMNKRQSLEQIKKALVLNEEIFGNNYHDMMIGMPSESLKTLQESIDMCVEHNFTPEAVFFVTPYPGTHLYKHAWEKGLITNEEEFVLSIREQGEDIACNLTNFSDEELRWLKNYMVKKVKAQNEIVHEEKY